MEKLSSESEPEKEIFKRVELRAERDHLKHTWSLVFDSESPLVCAAYNRAIEEVLPKNMMGAAHHGATQHAPGAHSWEFWGATTREEKIKELFSDIQDLAEERFKDYEEAGMKKYWEDEAK